MNHAPSSHKLAARGAVNGVTVWQLGNAAAGIKLGAAVASVDVVAVESFVRRRYRFSVDLMRECIADKLFFVMPIAPVFFRCRALAQALVEN